MLFVADDIFGNFYAINLGAIDQSPDRMGAVYAMCPTYLDWCIVADKFAHFLFDVLEGSWSELLGAMGLSNVVLPDNQTRLRNLSAAYYPPLFTSEGGAATSSVALIDTGEALSAAREIRATLLL